MRALAGVHMPKRFSFKPGLTLGGRKFKGLRGWAGKPFHPPLTDFPIVTYVLVGGFDLVGSFVDEPLSGELYTAGHFVLISGLIVSVGAALTGFWDWWKSSSPGNQVRRTINTHMLIMLTVTGLAILNLILRGADWTLGSPPAWVAILSVANAVLVGTGAAYGGEITFDYGFNVEVAGDSVVWHPSEEDLQPGQEGYPAERPG